MRRAASVAVVVGTAVVFVAALVGLVLNVTAPAGHDLNRVSEIVYLSGPLVPALLGGFLALRRPKHPAGWLLAYLGLQLTVDSLCKGILHRQTYGPGRSFSGLVRWAGWVDNWTWLTYFGALTMLFLLFPDGHPLSRRWRLLVRAIGPVVAVSAVLIAAVRSNEDYRRLRLPVNLGPISALPRSVVVGVVFTAIFGSLAAAVVSLVVRRRRAIGAERAQLRWLLWAAGLAVGLSLVPSLLSKVSPTGPNWRLLAAAADVLQELAAFGIPVAVFVAVSRHGLFEIDRVVSRTVSYSLLTAILAGFYVAVVTSISALVPVDLGRLPVAAATLVVAALFVPLRRRVGHAVDHRFNRSRFDAEQVIAGFADRVRGAAADDVTADDLVLAVRTVLQPAYASVWLMPSGRPS